MFRGELCEVFDRVLDLTGGADGRGGVEGLCWSGKESGAWLSDYRSSVM